MSQNSFYEEKYLHDTSSACKEELVTAIKEITGLTHMKLSDGVFQKSAMLVLTNRRMQNYPSDNPMVGVVGSEKILKLYGSGKDCWIALLNQSGKIMKKRVLHQCRCSEKEAN